jgi:hypothetical protein
VIVQFTKASVNVFSFPISSVVKCDFLAVT